MTELPGGDRALHNLGYLHVQLQVEPESTGTTMKMRKTFEFFTYAIFLQPL